MLIRGRLLCWFFLIAGTGDASEVPDLSGAWSGGFGQIGGDEPTWTLLRAELEFGGARFRGTARVPERSGTVGIDGRGTGNLVEFQLRGANGNWQGNGQLAGTRILGTVHQGPNQRDFQLVRIHPLTEQELRDRAGLYVAEDRRIVLSRVFATGQLGFLDLETGVSRVLFPSGSDLHRGGVALFVPHPVTHVVRFDPGKEGMSLQLEESGVMTRFRRQGTLRHEEFWFESEGVTLRGRLTLPEESGVYPAVVGVHGSGPATRDHTLHWPAYCAAHGFAFLGFDKRGCGESEGVYAVSDIVAHTMQRGRDVRAAVRALQDHPEIDPEGVGLAGASQAGWVSAVAAEEGDCAFVIVRNGGAVCYAKEGRYSVLSREFESKASNPSIASILPEVRRVPVDYDWTPHFARMSCPSLFLYGLRDRVNPSILCVEFLREIASEHQRDFTIREFPTGSHAMFDAQIGGIAELGTLERMVPGYFQAIEQWWKDQGLLASPH